MASPAGETVVLKIIESSGEEEEKESATKPSTDQPRTVVDITWDSSKQGQI